MAKPAVQFSADGQFIDSPTTYGSTGFSNFVAVPPDRRGTYSIGANGVMTFSYASGKVVTGVMALSPNAQTGATNPAVEGFVLDQENFFVPDADG